MDRHDELGPVRRHDRHAVAPADALGGEMARQRVGGPVELAVGPAVVAGQDGRVIGERAAAADSSPRCMRLVAIGETFFSELRFSVNSSEVYGYRREEGRAGVSDTSGAATDEEVRSEIIETVRRFVQREVIPVAADLERQRHLTRARSSSRCGRSASSASPSPRSTAGSGSTC